MAGQLADLFVSQLPEPLQNIYNQYAPYTTNVHPLITRLFFLSQSLIFKYLYPTAWAVYSVLSKISGGDTSSITLTSIFLTVLTALFSLYAFNFVRRRIVALVYSMIYFVFWVVVLTLGVAAYYRGLDQTVEDVTNLAGLFLDGKQQGKKRGAGKARMKEQEAYRTRRRGY